MAARRPAPKLGFPDLVQAFLDDARHHGRGDAVAAYSAKRLQLLREGLECSFIARPVKRDDEDERADAAARDRNDVRSIGRDCLRNHAALYPPFGAGLVGRPGPLELRVRKRNAEPLREAVQGLKDRLADCFADCLRALDPQLEGRTMSAELLTERGLPRRAPVPDDDW